MSRTRVGIIGCGGISPAYFTAPQRFPTIEVVACADLDVERAKQRAGQFGVERACAVDELLATDLDVVVNLTPPAAHFDVSMAAIGTGKPVYSEKPLAATLDQADELLAAADSAGVLLGCSPDTFLSPAYQTARAMIEWGAIGDPVGAVGFFASGGPEHSHPHPDFFYQPGAGPLLDMGPYYLSALVNLLGPVARVSGVATSGADTRLTQVGPNRGTVFDVTTPTHICGMLEFQNDTVAMVMTSFDVWSANLPYLEVYGTGGSLSLPDPNEYAGCLRWRQRSWSAWRDVPVGTYPAGRGIGLADMARALRVGRQHRTNGVLARHVLEVLLGVLRSHDTGRHVSIDSTVDRGLPVGPEGVERD
jgi:predicted dehydrogenase